MKKSSYIKRTTVAFVALSTSIGISPNAEAIFLQYEGGVNAGTIVTQAPVRMKFTNLDMGAQYTGLTPVPIGNINPAIGVPILDVAPGIPATGSLANPVNSPFGNFKDDSWGIAKVTEIYKDGDNSAPIWTPSVKGFEINVVFYGEQDTTARLFTDAFGVTSQVTTGVNLRVDFYQNPLGTFDLIDQNGSTGRLVLDAPQGAASQSKYEKITNTALPGTSLLLSTVSVGGFISAGDLFTSFQTNFVPAGKGQGLTFLNVTGGSDAGQFDTNGIASLVNPVPNADFSAIFTTDAVNGIPPGANSDWLVSSDDPIRGNVIPEPATSLAGLACLLPVFGTFLGRRRKR